MKKLIILLFISILSFESFSNNRTIDSLKYILSSTQIDTVRVNTYNELFIIYKGFDLDKAYEYVNKALKLSQKINFKKGEANSLNNLGLVYHRKNEYSKSLEYYNKSLAIKDKIKDDYGTSITYNNMGYLYQDLNNSEKALEYYNKALEIDKKLNVKSGIASSYNNIGTIYYNQGDYTKTIKYYLDANKLFQEEGLKLESSITLMNIGNIYYVQNNYKKANEYYNQSLEIKKELNDQQGIANIYNNIGSIHFQQKNFKLCLDYYKKALEIRKQINDKRGIAASFNNIGTIYFEEGKINEALEYKFKSLDIKKEIGEKYGISLTLTAIGRIYLESGDFNEAISYLNSSLDIAYEIKNKILEKDIYSYLAKTYAEKNDFKQAYHYHNLYSDISDSIYYENKDKQLEELQISYETEKRVEEIEHLKNISELNSENKKTQKKYIIGSAILLILIIIISIRAIFVRQKSKRLIAQKIANLELLESEKKYKELANLLPQTVFELDINRKFTIINSAGLSLTGYSKFDLINGFYIDDIIIENDLKRFQEDILYILEGGKYKGQEYIMIRKDKSTFPGITYISPIKDKNNVAVGYRGIIIDITEQKHLERKLLSSVIETEDKERKQFSEDLHDGLGPLLSTIKLYFNQLNAEGIDKIEKKEMIKYTNELIDDAITTARSIANHLMPETISDNGLIPAINSFCEKLNFTKTINVVFKTSNINQRYPNSVETAIYRIIIELINNTIKHAAANNINILMKEDSRILSIIFEDDGIGFDPALTLRKEEGLGLNNVLNRAKSINAKCKIESHENKGTIVNISVNLN
ncbi:MAG: tetratricopeptide repeat protein [Saprospiraceae bacterium]|nr:tetratricopeptide repeat protein [Saprospiraceae bacterium]